MHTLQKIVITIFVLLVAGNVSAFAEEEQNTETMYKKQLVDAVLGEELFENGVTRGAFVDAMCKVFRIDAGEVQDSYFSDVMSSTPYANSIYYAANAGYVSKGEKFYPDNNITYNEAVKIAVSFLGYSYYAESSGGYPMGYLNIAAQLDITKEVDAVDEFDTQEAYNLIFNILNTSPVIKKPSGNGFEFSQGGPTVLEMLYHINMTEGIITGTAYNTLTDKETYGQLVFIDGKAYYCEQTSPEMLGMNYRAYYDDDENIFFMYPEKNVSITLDVRNNFKIEGSQAIYMPIDDSKNKTYRLNPAYYFIYNGKKADISEIDFDYLLGYVTLSDNNSDGLYDTVFIAEYDFITVDQYKKSEMLISDNKGKTLSLDDVQYILYDSDGNPASLGTLESGNVLMFIKSLDGNLVIMHVLNSSEELFVNSVDKTSHTMWGNDKEYYLSKYFLEKYSALSGREAEFTTYKDIIVSSNFYVDRWQYGYMMGYYTEPAENNVGIKIFNDQSEIIRCMVDTKIRIDGISYKNIKESDIRNLFCSSSGKFTEQLVRFKQNGEGKITGIDTAVENSSSEIETNNDENDSLTEYTFAESTFLYKSQYKSCTPYFNLQNAIVFVIPSDSTLTDKYRVKTADYFFNDQRISLKVYDLNESFGASAVVFKEDSENRDLGGSDTYLITKTLQAVDEDDNLGYQLELWSNNRYYYYFAPLDLIVKKDNEIYGATRDASVLCKGDLIRLDVDEKGEIKNITVDFDANPEVFSQNGSTAPFNGANGTPMYQTGKVYTYEDPYILLTRTKTGAGYDFSVSNLRLFPASTSNIVRFDVKNGIAQQATTNDIKSYIANGDDANFVVLRQNNYNPQMLVIYEGLEEVEQ